VNVRSHSRRLDTQAGLLPWSVVEGREDASVTSFGGLLLAVEAFEAFGLRHAVEQHVRTKQRERGLSDAEWVCVYMALLLSGGRAVSDIAALRADAGLRRAWPLLERVGERAAYDFLYRFRDGECATPGKAVIRKECAALQGLGRVRDHLTAMVQAVRAVDVATLDADASIHEAKKRDALWTYDGVRGYQPFIITWAEQRLIVRDQFRDGNVGAGFATLSEIQAAFAALPASVTTRRFRSDSACYEQRTLRWCERNGIEFGISADMSPQLRAACCALPDAAWKVLHKRDARGRRTPLDKQWAEVLYVPDEPGCKKGERPFRFLAMRVPRQRDLFEEQQERWTYSAIVTNRDGDGEELIHWQRERCGTVEAAHDVLKNDAGAAVLPSNCFGANAAWYRLAVLAHNLHVALSHGMPAEWKKRRLSSWQFSLLRVAARLTHHARTLHLLLSDGARAIGEAIVAARRFLRDRVRPVAHTT